MPVPPQKYAEANKHPLNRAALMWLQEAKEFSPEAPTCTFWRWGSGTGTGGWAANRDAHQNQLLEQQLRLKGAWDPQNVVKWLVNNPDGPNDPREQAVSLRRLLESAPIPKDAAANLLEWIGDRMQAGSVSAFQNPASELR